MKHNLYYFNYLRSYLFTIAITPSKPIHVLAYLVS